MRGLVHSSDRGPLNPFSRADDGELVTVHMPDGRTVEGRTWTGSSGRFVIDWKRSSYADNGCRAIPAGAVVHGLRVRCDCKVSKVS